MNDTSASSVVVGVHGIGNYSRKEPAEAAATLARTWTRNLGQPVATVAYFAHRLASVAQGPAEDLDMMDLASGGQVSELLARWIEQLGGQLPLAQGERLAGTARQLASWFSSMFVIDQVRAERYLGKFAAEVLRYFDPIANRRESAISDVANCIATFSPKVVIAHSLGSVVAYEALGRHPTLSVELFLTVGSPLAMPGVIFERLRPTVSSARRPVPAGVRRWINVADPADVVAQPPRLSDHFDGFDPSDDLRISGGALFTHRSAKYLRMEQVRQCVRQALRTGRGPS